MSQAKRLTQALNALQFVLGEASVEWLEEDGFLEAPEIAVHIADVEGKLTELRMKINAAIALKEHKRSCRLVEGEVYVLPNGTFLRLHEHNPNAHMRVSWLHADGSWSGVTSVSYVCSALMSIKEYEGRLIAEMERSKEIQRLLDENLRQATDDFKKAVNESEEIVSRLRRLKLLQTST